MEWKRSVQDLWAASRHRRRILKETPSDNDNIYLQRAADQARDAQQWSEATTYYSKYLDQIPSDTAIWVQFGNCSKEAGQYKQALEAYDTAITLDDSAADTHLQKGHLLKMMGRRDDAIASYLRSFELQPKGNLAFDELLALDAGTVIGAAMREGDDIVVQAQERIRRAATVGDSAMIYLDITDLIDYLRLNESLSGIQRVVSNLIIYSEEFMKSSNGSRIRPVLPDFNESVVYAARLSLLEQLVAMVREGRSERRMLDRAIEAVLSTKSLVKLHPGDTLLIAGAFWIFGRYDLLNQLRQQGVRVTVFIHDLLQITNPEYVEAAATKAFRRSFVDILYVSSYILTNSKFVAGEVERYLQKRLNFSIPAIPVTLATELGMLNVKSTSVSPEYYLELVTEEYVLCVGTIEIRKNHMYVIKIWERLIEEFDGHVPNLVFVGKWGWKIDELQEYLADSDYLGARLYIYSAISDYDLAFLYQHCLFTIYSSFAEGWGLPVGESLGYGRPCVASKVTAIPEVGGPLCKYFDPLDLEDGYAVVSAILSDRGDLAAWAARVKKQFKRKTWNDFSSELFGVVRRYGRDKTIDHSRNNSIIEIGEIAPFGDAALPPLDGKLGKMVTARMTRMSGWHELEPWGCWAARRRATLKLDTRLPPDTDVIVYLHLRIPDSAEIAECTIKISGTSTFVDRLGPVPRWYTAAGKVSDGGVIDIILISGKGFLQSVSDRESYVDILDLAVAPMGDAAAQFQLLDRIVPGGLHRADVS